MMAAVDIGAIFSIGFWLALLVVLAVGGFFAARRIKNWTQREEEDRIFTIQDLRDMKAAGQITEVEFQTMRAALLAQFGHKKAADPETRKPDAPPETE